MYQFRLCTRADAVSVRDIFKYYIEETAITFEMVLPSVEEFEQRITTVMEQFPWIVVTKDQQLVGFAYGAKHRVRQAYQWCTELSVYVIPEFQKEGLAKHLYNGLFLLLKEQGFFNAYAGITLPNDKSLQFHKRLGFIEIAKYQNIGWKLGAWHDVIWCHKRIQQYTDNPPIPIGPLSLEKDKVQEILAKL
ncbi:MAG: L-amino acid N-acyltransferase YncA [Vicingaceae bacterium]|jgi:L-amino acid N-acyltransferase YncA